MSRRTALFGGTFDPIHHGHLIVARSLAEQRGFDRVILVPAGQPPHKGRPLADAAHRGAMCRLAVEGEAALAVSDIEIDRPPPSYTIDTVEDFRRTAEADEALVWVIGADMLMGLETWHRIERLIELVDFVVLHRPPVDCTRIEVAFSHLAGALGESAAARLRESLWPPPQIEISSTDIRNRLQRGASVRYLLPGKVIEYIERNCLYRQPAG